MIWIADPLHRLSRRWRLTLYLYLAIWFARLAVWYAIEDRWGKA